MLHIATQLISHKTEQQKLGFSFLILSLNHPLTTNISEISNTDTSTQWVMKDDGIGYGGWNNKSSKADLSNMNEHNLYLTLKTTPVLSSKVHGCIKQASQLRNLQQGFCWWQQPPRLAEQSVGSPSPSRHTSPFPWQFKLAEETDLFQKNRVSHAT